MARNIKIMGIINVTGDSYFPESRCPDAASAVERAEKLVSQGADILDIGGCSTRPGAKSVDEKTEWERLYPAITAIRKEFPSVPLSIDSFRSGIVVKTYYCIGKHIVNDISAGAADPEMLGTAGRLGLTYVAMHMRGTPETMAGLCDYGDVTEDVAAYFMELLPKIEAAGIKECIVDPGFGFSKTLDQNYRLLASLEVLQELGCPLLAGVSRKSMIYNLLGVSPEESLGGTIAVNTLALLKGASILRVHDVKEAVETVAIVEKFREQSPC